ncbi:response regulator [Rhodobium gokarnense]|uniref:PleD family two-component response regulator n=1 Tax=Rhodobium gokarnense TaxID=364296 RepID=A0ABT3HBE6_9HYPH|nr:response regulator [Rhodobium gokarnense]MCW2307717.1 PleD family two-component response regulator [Rhodobium gokarnense]
MNASVSRILIVDDSEDAADITAAYLEDSGFADIQFARSATDAFAMLGVEPSGRDSDADADADTFDLVIMDIMMPEVDGIEACARIRLHPAGRDLPVLMLSGMRDTDALNQAFIAGANDFVGKPVSQIDLTARVRTLLRFKREQERRQLREVELQQRHEELARGELGGTLVDPLTRLASPFVMDVTLRSCMESGASACLALIQIDEFAAFRALHGDEATDDLLRRVAAAIARVPAPLTAVLTAYEPGAFMIVEPNARDAFTMHKTCEFARRRIADLEIRHGNSIHNAFVTASSAASLGTADALVDLPAHLLAEFGRQWSHGDSHVEIA